jgi:hypothetical protein
MGAHHSVTNDGGLLVGGQVPDIDPCHLIPAGHVGTLCPSHKLSLIWHILSMMAHAVLRNLCIDRAE